MVMLAYGSSFAFIKHECVKIQPFGVRCMLNVEVKSQNTARFYRVTSCGAGNTKRVHIVTEHNC